MSGKKEGLSLHGLTDKIMGGFAEKVSMADKKRLLMTNVPYIIVFYLTDKLSWLYLHGKFFCGEGRGAFPEFPDSI